MYTFSFKNGEVDSVVLIKIMITPRQTVTYRVDFSVIPISNDLKKYPIRAYYDKRSNSYNITVDTHKFIHHKKYDAYYANESFCPICKKRVTVNSQLQFLRLSQEHITEYDRRYARIAVLQLDFDTTYYLMPVKLRVIKHENQQYLVSMHDACYDKYKLCPLGYDLASNTHK